MSSEDLNAEVTQLTLDEAVQPVERDSPPPVEPSKLFFPEGHDEDAEMKVFQEVDTSVQKVPSKVLVVPAEEPTPAPAEETVTKLPEVGIHFTNNCCHLLPRSFDDTVLVEVVYWSPCWGDSILYVEVAEDVFC